jgi:uncharacterized protein
MKPVIKQIIKEFHLKKPIEIIDREYKIPLDSKKIISLIGPRRSGKTFLLYQLMREIKDKTNILYLNFEDDRLNLEQKDLKLIFEAYFELYPEKKYKEIYVFFDEVQEIKGWEKFVRRIYDTITDKIFITGSSAKLLSKEIATNLRGRTIKYDILPLSFREYLKFKRLNESIYTINGKAILLKEFKLYLKKGGFPETVNMVDEIHRKTINEYLDVMIYRDIIERYSVKNINSLNYLIRRVLTNPSGEISINKIYHELKSNGVKVTKDYLYSYIHYLDEAFIISILKNYSESLIKQGIKKVYPIDTSLSMNSLMGTSDELGKLLETICYNELKRQNREIYYFSEKRECDFTIREKNRIIRVIQVCYVLNEKNKNREIEGLIEAMDKFKLKKGLILTLDQEEELKVGEKKILVKPVWKWILEN